MLAYQVWLLSRMDPLKSLFEKPALSGRTARWQLLLSEFDITYVTQKSIKARAPPAYLKLRPLSSNQCLPWPVLPCSYLHRKRTALFNPAFCHSLTSFPLRLFSRSLDDTLLPNCLGPAQSQDPMRTSCRCSGAVGLAGKRTEKWNASSALPSLTFLFLS